MAHQIFPHGQPEQLAPNLWQVRGSLSIPLRRNMTVYKLADGRLVLYSAVAMNDEGLKALEALGRPAFLVVPHKNHAMDAAFYRARYPDIKVVCPAEGKGKVEERVQKIDGTPEEVLPPLGIKVHPVTGMKLGEFALEVDVPGGKALVTNDILGGPTPGEKTSFFLRLTGPPGGVPFGVARIVRIVMVKDKVAVRHWLHLMAENSDIKIITVSHGPPQTGDCAQKLRDAAATI